LKVKKASTKHAFEHEENKRREDSTCRQ